MFEGFYLKFVFLEKVELIERGHKPQVACNKSKVTGHRSRTTDRDGN